MTVDPDLRKVFALSASKITSELRKTLALCARDPEDETLWQRLTEKLDLLRSDARQAQASLVAELAACMSLVPQGAAEGRFRMTPTHLRYLEIVLEHLEARIAEDGAEKEIPLSALRETADHIYATETFSLHGLSIREILQAASGGPADKGLGAQADDTIQIPEASLQRVSGRMDSVIVHQFQLKKNLDLIQTAESGLRVLMDELKLPAETADPAARTRLLRLAEQASRDLLGLDRSFKEDMAALDRVSYGLQEEIAKLRMQPFGRLGARIEASVKLLAAQAGKTVAMEWSGSEMLLDKGIQELLEPPLEEIVANAVRHGISQAGGLISIACSGEGSSLSITVADYGPGLDTERIREAAMKLYPLEKEAIAGLAAEQVHRYVFHPGIGSGLVGVKKSLDALQGKAAVRSAPGRGTVFELQFPASLSLISGFFIRAAGEKFFISSVFVREIVLFKRSELVDLSIGQGYRLREMIVPVLPLASVLQGRENVRKEVEQMLVFELAGETAGLLVESIVRHATLSYKPLPEALAAMKEFQGVVYDERFNLVPILHIPAVMDHLKRVRSIEFRDRYTPEKLEFLNILLVDDSETSRQTLQRALKEAGYTVETAGDGIEALEILHRRHFHLIITDDDMPRMDGLTLVDNLRKESEYASTAVIGLLTSDRGPRRRQWESLGVSAFFAKADFDRLALLERVGELLR